VFVVCCVAGSLCDEPITRSEESYRVCMCVCVSNCVWSINLNNEAAPFGLLRNTKENLTKDVRTN